MKLHDMDKMTPDEMAQLQKEQKECRTKCCMCKQKLDPEKCLKTKCGMISFECAKHCMMCPGCKTVVTPEEMKSCKQKGMCCGMKLQPMKNMSEHDMSKLKTEQKECAEKMCPMK
jgi:hypothetical protein